MLIYRSKVQEVYILTAMENNIVHYYYESDFKLVDLNVQEGLPFEFRYYVKRRGEVVIASYDGEKYTGCRPSDEVAGAIVVPFDNDGGKLGIGTLKVKRVYDIVDADMADGVFNSVTEQVLPIELWRGPSDDVAGDAVIVYDSLYRGKDGKSAYQIWLDLGNEGTEEDFIASLGGSGGGSVVIVDNLTDGGSDKALSAEMGKVLGEDVARVEDSLADVVGAVTAINTSLVGTIGARRLEFQSVMASATNVNEEDILNVDVAGIVYNSKLGRFLAVVRTQILPLSAIVTGSAQGSYGVGSAGTYYTDTLPIAYFADYGFVRFDGRQFYPSAPIPSGYGDEGSYYSNAGKYYQYAGGIISETSRPVDMFYSKFVVDQYVDNTTYGSVDGVEVNYVCLSDGMVYEMVDGVLKKKERYVTEGRVEEMIANAITNALNTEV